MTGIEIGHAKRGHREHSFDDIAVVPSRRTRDEIVSEGIEGRLARAGRT